jgi:large subunit ribosomal protein L25
MKKYQLNANVRKLVGRKVKNLRKNGEIPATIYGKNITSMSISVKAIDFEKVYAEAGETGLIELKLEKENKPVLINTIQKHPVNRDVMHIEFHQVDLKEKVKTHVPLEFIGIAQAVTNKEGALLELLQEIEVEALPMDLPEKIEVDVSGLIHVNDEIKVSKLKIISGVTFLTDPEVIMVKVASIVSKAAKEEEAKSQAAAAAAASVAAEKTGTEAAPADAGAAVKAEPAKDSKPTT